MISYLESLLHRLPPLSRVKHFHARLIISGQFQIPICPTRSKFLELCALTFRNLSFAVHVFRRICCPSTNDWNAILRGMIESAAPIEAFIWYRDMIRGSHRVDALTCTFVLKACVRVLASLEPMQLHSQIERKGFAADSLLGTTLLDGYAKVGDMQRARKVFDEIADKDIASWNALIAGFAQQSDAKEALSLFKSMGANGFKPNAITVLAALSACSQLGALKEGEKICWYIKDEGLDANVQVCNSAMDMYAKCGFVDEAYAMFGTMHCERSIVTWNTMIMAFAMHGDGQRALRLFEQMNLQGAAPDAVSYLGVLCACNHGGLVEAGFSLFNSMKKHVVPNIKHYGTVVDLLGRAGRLHDAYDVINSMPMPPDAILWQTLLGACKTHGNVEMAELVSQRLLQMGSNADGDFILLSNVYAAHERWADVGKTRKMMKNREVEKVPGVSYIESKGVIHRFYNGDKDHESCKEIYAKLDEFMFKIQEHGYVAETSFVLHDIGEEEKANALCHHSEKLALAFGLISAREGAPIQVFKNIRICGDCHIVIKLVSKLYKHDIIVRDRARFHRFKDGSCSCNDYW